MFSKKVLGRRRPLPPLPYKPKFENNLSRAPKNESAWIVAPSFAIFCKFAAFSLAFREKMRYNKKEYLISPPTPSSTFPKEVYHVRKR